MKITKEQIVALDKKETTVRELFPEVFETKLEDNTYYIFESGEIQFNVKDGEGYGFNKFRFHEEVKWVKYPHNGVYRKATKEEVETALINELIKLGFKKGVNVKGLGLFNGILSGNNCLESKMFSFDFKLNIVYANKAKSENIVLFENGKFAEIIHPKQMTKEEIEKELGYEIEIKL